MPSCKRLANAVHVSHKAIQCLTMAATKTIAMSLRVTPQFKALLEAAARRENRSQANMLEHLLMEFCRTHDIKAPSPSAAISE
jgi:hypothetical protein